MKVFHVEATTLTLALFVDVCNSRELLDLMQAGTVEPEVALLNASLIPDVFPVLAAAHKTLISESLKRCGISDSSTYVLVARFGASTDEITAIANLIRGREINLSELEGRANQAHIQKHYKISGVELTISSLGDAITSRIAARDAL